MNVEIYCITITVRNFAIKIMSGLSKNGLYGTVMDRISGLWIYVRRNIPHTAILTFAHRHTVLSIGKEAVFQGLHTRRIKLSKMLLRKSTVCRICLWGINTLRRLKSHWRIRMQDLKQY